MKRTLLLFGLSLVACLLRAQQTDVLSQAEEAYNNGRFEQVDSLLLPQVRAMKGASKVNAYRLLTLSALCQDNATAADSFVAALLEADPYYTVYNEAPRFVNLINAHKQQEAGITTASRQAESLIEAPVPVTLITEDMIRLSGAQTLQELFTLFVPGMTLAEGLESNIAMHGIYSITQNKILFLQDGHRLNSGSAQSEAPDFRNSLDKIQQIEVLRGPASSLYGSVALTAVVNIITRKGAALSGGRLSGTIGTQQTHGGSFVVGGGNNVLDVLGWGSINQTDGFSHTIDNGMGGTTELYSHAFRDRPSYDLGIKARWKDFSLTFNSQRSKQCPYINVIQIPATQQIKVTGQGLALSPSTPDYDGAKNFSYGNYSSIYGNGPGTTRTNHHLNLDYAHTIGDITLSAAASLSMERTDLYNVLGDSIERLMAQTLMQIMMVQQMGLPSTANASALPYWTRNAWQNMDWENYTLGAQLQMAGNYRLLGHGTGTMGVQYEHFALTGSNISLGGESATPITYTLNDIISKGHEDLVGVFAQLKHYLPGNKFIVNTGVRYDHKKRFNGENLDRFSPRVSLIYKLRRDLSLLASYNYSLVDAPYVYRASSVRLFSGGTDMKAETMKSFNVGANYRQPNSHWQADASVFYNSMQNLLHMNSTMQNDYLFLNSGTVKQVGAEGSVQYTAPRLLVNLNATWQRIVDSEDYAVYRHETYGTPAFCANLTGAWAFYDGTGSGCLRGSKLWLRAMAQVQSETHYVSSDFITSFNHGSLATEVHRVAPQIVPSVSLGYEWKYLDMDLSLKNITNRQYLIGSTLSDGVPRNGRQLLFKLTVKF